MNEEERKPMQKNILAAIEAGKVKMRPRWQYLLRGGLLAAGLVLAALAVLFVGSFIVFLLQQNGAWFAPSFGGSGLRELFMALPLLFVAVALVFIVLLQTLMRRYSFSYGQPLLYSVIGVSAFVVIGSFLVAQSHIHEGLFRQARDQNLPIAGGFYRQFGTPQANRITTGVITVRRDDGFNMADHDDSEYMVIITRSTELPRGEEFEVGDDVIVLGDRNGNTITAEGVVEVQGRKSMYHERH
jgi:hypothetical protein